MTALHPHHIAKQPKLYYMHFWANADPASLAHALRAALDQTTSTVHAPSAEIGK